MDDDGKPSVYNNSAVYGQNIAGHQTIQQIFNAGMGTLPITCATPAERAWNVPYPRNPHFTGREDLLARLHEYFCSDGATALSQAISGLGGVGKTQLAVEYAYRYRSEYRYVLWARSESREDLMSAYVSLARLLGLPQNNEKDQQVIVDAVKRWLENHSDWLLIFDNADEPGVLLPFIPAALQGHCLYTTRASTLGNLASTILVESCTNEQGALLLLRRAGLRGTADSLDHALKEDRELAIQISRELGGLPLALDQAGAYIEEAQISLVDYLRLYQQRHAELLDERGGFAVNHPEPVTTTWSLSFERMAARNPAAVELLRFLAFLAPDDIPEEIITGGSEHLGETLVTVASDAYLLDKAVKALLAYSLVKRDRGQKTLTVHRLVQGVLRDAISARERRQWMERAVLAVEEVLPSLEFPNWTVYERLLAHALLCATWIEHEQFQTLQASRLLNQAGSYLFERARLTEAEPLLQRALAIGQAQSGPLHPLVVSSLNNLASLCKDQGRYEQAASLYGQALQICEKQLGSQHFQTAVCLNNLADLYMQQDRPVEAEPLYGRALAISEKQFGLDHPQTAACLSNLATIYLCEGKYTEAEPLLRRSLTINEEQLDPEDPHITSCLCNLGGLYAMQKRYDEALPLLRRALAINKKHLGPEHPETAKCLDNLAIIFLNQGKYDEAAPLLHESLTINEKQYGLEHRQTVRSLHTLAVFYEVQERYEEAKAFYRRAFRICERLLGPGHPETRKMLVGLAELSFQNEVDGVDSTNYPPKNYRVKKKSKRQKRRKR